jgi:hypothetical protein
MNSHFLLPCECGQTTPIQVSQAGQSVRCVCGRELAVPTMRGIRELKPAAVAPTKVSTQRNWNQTRGMIFGAGALSILFGLILIGFNYPLYRNYSAFQPTTEDVEFTMAQIDATQPADLWDLWHFATEHGLGAHEDSMFVNARKQAQHYLQWVITGAVLLGLGALLVTTPMLMPNQKN